MTNREVWLPCVHCLSLTLITGGADGAQCLHDALHRGGDALWVCGSAVSSLLHGTRRFNAPAARQNVRREAAKHCSFFPRSVGEIPVEMVTEERRLEIQSNYYHNVYHAVGRRAEGGSENVQAKWLDRKAV